MDAAQLPSIRRLSEAAGLSHNAVTRVVHGDSLPGDETVSALASALRVPASKIYELTHGQDITARPWSPPAEVQRLTRREQDALSEMIRSMAAARDQEEVRDHEQPSAPMTEAGEQPAPRGHTGEYGLAAHPHDDTIADDQLPEEGP